MADLQGWSRGTWGEGEFGEFIPVSVTGVQSNTNVGTLTITADAVVQPTGVSSGAVLGTAIGEAESIYPVTGVQSNTATGTLEAQEGHGVQPTGVEINFALDTENQTFDAVGDAALSTAQFKFGGSSLELDGTGDYIESNRDYTLGLGDWTFETFVRFNNFSGFQYIWDSSENVGSNDSPILYITATNIIFKFGGGASQIDVAHNLSTDTWHHIAVTRDGRDYEIYIDGNSVGTNTDTVDQDIPSTVYTIGAAFGGGLASDGYFDETRISTSVRYTSNFTPPTSEFTTDSNTLILLHFDGANGSTDIIDSAAPLVITTVDAGWGRNTWGSFAWGENITIFANLVGQQLSTDIGTVTTQTGTGVDAPVTGNSVATTLGAVSLVTDQVISFTGFNINALLQNPTILADGNVTTSAPGDQMDTAIGSVNINIFTQVDVTAITSTFETGTLGMSGDANFSLTGSQANTNVGTVTTVTGTGVNVATTGVSIQFAEGTETISGSAIVTPTGVEFSVILGNMRSTPWANVVTGASNTWTEVAA